MAFPIMIKDLVKCRNKSETFLRRKIGPWFGTRGRESSLRGSNGAPSVSELNHFHFNATISILRQWINCLELDFITSVFCSLLFFFALNNTHWCCIFYFDDIFHLNVAFSSLMLHFLFWRHVFYLDDIFYLGAAFFILIAFSTWK